MHRSTVISLLRNLGICLWDLCFERMNGLWKEKKISPPLAFWSDFYCITLSYMGNLPKLIEILQKLLIPSHSDFSTESDMICFLPQTSSLLSTERFRLENCNHFGGDGYYKRLRDQQELEDIREESQDTACKIKWNKLALFCLER